MKLFKRTDHVQEIQEGKLTAFKSQACTSGEKNCGSYPEQKIIWVSLIWSHCNVVTKENTDTGLLTFYTKINMQVNKGEPPKMNDTQSFFK
jgi:hypothetical protein